MRRAPYSPRMGSGISRKVDVDFRRVSNCGNDVVSEVAVDGMTIARVVGGVLEQPHADSDDDRTCDLISRCTLVARISNVLPDQLSEIRGTDCRALSIFPLGTFLTNGVDLD